MLRLRNFNDELDAFSESVDFFNAASKRSGRSTSTSFPRPIGNRKKNIPKDNAELFNQSH